MTETRIVDIIRAVPLDSLTKDEMPEDIRVTAEELIASGMTVADIATIVDESGYRLVIAPTGTVEDAEDTESEDEDEESTKIETDYHVDEMEMSYETEIEAGNYDTEKEHHDDDDDDRGGLLGLLDRLRTVFGKALSVDTGNASTSDNRQRVGALAPRLFIPSPMAKDLMSEYGVDPMAHDSEHEHEHESQLGDLTLRSAALAEAHDLIVDALGCFRQSDAHYIDESPFLDEGLACLNCVAYCPEVGGCYWVEGSIAPEGICKLWVIPERLQIVEMMSKEVVEVDGRFRVTSADGSRSFGTYDTRAEAEARLAEVERFAKADTFDPPAGVREEAARAEAWIAEGHAGDGFTPTGRRRASDLAAGNPVSLDTVERIASYLARHEADKQGEGWSPGEPGYPSPGRVAWAAWGGDPAVSWTRGILDGIDKGSPSVSDVHVEVPMGSGGRSRRRLVSPAGMMSKRIGVGSYVSWGSSGGRGRGQIERISTDRPIAVPDSSFTIDASEDDPAALIRLWEETSEGWRPTDRRVGHRVGTLTEIDALERSIPSVFAKAEERRFTLGPWYVPDSYDAHGEWTDSTELQSALWDYVRKGDRQIRLQHDVEIVAGEWVEALTWPYAVSVPMLDAGSGLTVEQEFPPGTVFMGVVWESWAWDLVKAGKIRGYSMGGAGQRVTVDLPSEGNV
jgi:hypothetical protein